MKAQYDSNWLADDDNTMFDLRVNGRRIVQESNPIRASYAALFARKNRSNTITFSVEKTFDTVWECERFVVQQNNEMVDSATLLLRIGAFGETPQDITMAAKFEGADIAYKGVVAYVSYTFRFTTVSGVAPAPGGDPVVTSGTEDIASGAETGTVTGLALPSVPSQVIVSVSRPAGGLIIFAAVDSDTITADGFSYQLSGITDSANYNLDFLAIL